MHARTIPLPGRPWLPALAVGLACAATSAQVCGNGFLQLSVAGGRLGDTWTTTLAGPPGAPAALGFDFAAGSIPSPFGTVCLGPAPILLPLVLDPAGAGAFALTLPATASFGGLTFHQQGAAIDPAAPGGIGLSDGATTTFAPPRLFVLDLGSAFRPAPPRVIAYDVLTGVELWNRPFFTTAGPMVHSRAHGLLILWADGLGVVALDDATGATVFTSPFAADDLVLTQDEDVLLALSASVIRRLPLPAGGPPVDVPHGISAFGAGGRRPGGRMLPIPGTTLVYLLALRDVVPFDHATNQFLPPVAGIQVQGSLYDWALGNGRLAVVDRGLQPNPFVPGQPVIHVADTATHAAVPASPVAPGLTSFTATVRFGPTPAGPGFLVAYWNNGHLVEVLPGGTLGAVGSYGAGNADLLELSAGGTEWLMASRHLLVGSTDVLRIDPATLVPTAVATLPSAATSDLRQLDSETLRTGFVATTTSVFALPTDPAGTPVPFATPATASGTGLYVVDG